MKAQAHKIATHAPQPAAPRAPRKPRTKAERLAQREATLREYAPIVKNIAGRMALRLPPNVEVDDLVSAGTLGLIDALDKFDASKGITFRAYSEFRIRGAMLDELRAQDWISRSLRKKYKRVEATFSRLEQEHGRAPTDEEMTEALGLTLSDYHDFMGRMGSISFISVDEIADTSPNQSTKLVSTLYLEDDSADPHAAAELRWASEVLGEAIDQLPENERMVLHMYYYEDLNMKEIGEVMGISESRISQIHSKAILRMKTKMRRHRDALAA